jgi:hypothetical protein
MQAGLKNGSLLDRNVYLCKMGDQRSFDISKTDGLIVINKTGDLSTDFAMFCIFSRRS